MLWDLCEFLTLYLRQGYGITPKAHIGLEITLFLGLAAAVGMLADDLFSLDFFDYYYSVNTFILPSTELALVAILM